MTMQDNVIPKRGMEFAHASWLANDYKTPQRCRVTAIRSGVVYYRPIDVDGSLGGSMYCDMDRFPSKVKSVLATSINK